MKTKICNICLHPKNLSDFYAKKTSKDGFENRCKYCKNSILSVFYYENRDRKLNQKKIYNKNNREKERNRNNARIKNDPNFMLSRKLRDRFNKALSGNYKSGSAIKDLGCSVSEFKIYLESLFVKNMTWENYGEWEIDHIVPLVSFNLSDLKQIKIACNFKNLQPLWKEDHAKKSVIDRKTGK